MLLCGAVDDVDKEGGNAGDDGAEKDADNAVLPVTSKNSEINDTVIRINTSLHCHQERD